MARLGIRPDAILTSPLARCVQTAEIVAAGPASRCAATTCCAPAPARRRCWMCLAEYPDAECVLACGHQPDLSYITQELTGGLADYRRATLGLIDLRDLRPRHGTLVGLYPARVLRRIAGTP